MLLARSECGGVRGADRADVEVGSVGKDVERQCFIKRVRTFDGNAVRSRPVSTAASSAAGAVYPVLRCRAVPICERDARYGTKGAEQAQFSGDHVELIGTARLGIKRDILRMLDQ